MYLVCDLGTSNFRAAVVDTDGILSEPSVMARQRDEIVIGSDAHAMLGRNSEQIDIVTPIEGGVIRNVEAVAEVIKYCVNGLSSSRFRRKFSIALSAPWGLTQVEKKALEDAARLAGARTVMLMNASVAAALGANLPVDSPTGCLVVNLGGGVTEVALLSMNGIVACHSTKTGGEAINDAVVERVKREYSFLIGLGTAEQLKRELCQSTDSRGTEIRGRDLKKGLPNRLWIPRSTVDEPLQLYCETIVELVGQVISQCPPELAGDIIQRGVVLVGGGANSAAVVNRLASRLEAPVVIADDPETCVIQGMLKAQTRYQQSSRRQFNWSSPLRAVSAVGRLARR